MSVNFTKTNDFAQTAKDIFLEKLNAFSNPTVILPTGNTPLPFYDALRAEETVKKFTYLQLDEYLGLEESDDRLFKNWLAREILDPLDIPNSKRIQFMSSPDMQAENILDIQDWYANHGPADIAVLGIGENGHIGFNEPPSGPFDTVRHIDLSQETLTSNAVYWPDQNVPEKAVTLGLFEILQSTHIILLATGAAKNKALKQAFLEKPSPNCPASYLQKHGSVTVIGDNDALNGI